MPWGLPFPPFSSRANEDNNAEDGDPAPSQRHQPVPIQTNLPDDPARHEERLRAADERAKESNILATVARDRMLREAAPDRWQPDIDPNSEVFKAILKHFASRLKDEHDTLDSILSEELAPHERALLTPVDRVDNAPLAAIQARNTVLYSELLRSRRFKPWEPRADMAFKLTLVFFGLPVAPLRLSSNQAFERLAEQSGWEDELLLPHEDGEPPADGRLRFLNEYQMRMYEQDGLRHPDPSLEAYYAYHRLREIVPAGRAMDELRGPEHHASMSLRGGGGGDDDASEFSTNAESDSDVLMQQGADTPDVGDIYDASDIDDANTIHVASGIQQADDIHDADDGHDAIDTHDPNDGYLSLRGGAGLRKTSPEGVLGRVQRGATIKNPSQQHSQFSLSAGVKAGGKGFWVPMRGYMGIVWFNIFSLYSFVDAVDRLLCLDNRAGFTYNIYLFDRDKDYTSSAEQNNFLSGDPENGVSVTCAGVGDYSHDKLALTAIVDRLSRAPDSDGGVDRTVIFIATPSDPIPLVWEPAENHRVIKLTLEWPNISTLNRLDVAYMRVPPEYKTSSHHYFNFFGLWMARACRVLGAGRSVYRPGRPTVPDAFFALKGAESMGSSYGGLCFPSTMWQEILRRWETDEGGPITLVARTPTPDRRDGEDEVTDRWNLFVPGYSAPFNDRTQQYLLFIEANSRKMTHDRIRNLMRVSLSDSAFEQLDVVEVYLPGDTFFSEADTAAPIHRVPMRYDENFTELEADQLVLRQSLEIWLDSVASRDATLKQSQRVDAFSSFITLRPIFLQYSIWGTGHTRVGWRPDNTSLDEFYKLAATASSPQERKRFRNGNASLAITQGTDGSGAGTGQLKKPQFLVTHLTTESEWRQITKLIVDPDVTVRWVREREHAPQDVDLESTQPFGFRDSYEPPLSFVYPELEEADYPDVTHHKDWQLLAEDVSEDLGTVQPWDRQPDTPPGPIGSDGCPVKFLNFGVPVSAPVSAKMAQVTAADSTFSSEAMNTPQTSEPMDTPQSSEPGYQAVPGVNAPEAGEDEDSEEDEESDGTPGFPSAYYYLTKDEDEDAAGEAEDSDANFAEYFPGVGEDKDVDATGQAEDSDASTEILEQLGAVDPQEPPQDPSPRPRPPVVRKPFLKSPPPRPPVARKLFPKSPMDKAAAKRKYSYAHPLSVHTEGNIPIHAPPLERLLRPPTESLPMVTQAFLTPTEVRQLQRDYFDMRSIVLRRSVQCNYAGCQAVFPANHPERMDRHLEDCHVSWGCNFCDERLFKHWPAEQKVKHFLDKHADYLEGLYKLKKRQYANADDFEPEEPENPFVTRPRSGSAGGVGLSGTPGPRTSAGSGGFISLSDIGTARASKASLSGSSKPRKATRSTQSGPAHSVQVVRPGSPTTAPALSGVTSPTSAVLQRMRAMHSGHKIAFVAKNSPPRPLREGRLKKDSVTLSKEVGTRPPTTFPRPPTAIPTLAPPGVAIRSPREGEALWRFCARCGRDHTVLDLPADREQHDAVCHPGNPHGTFCVECGTRNPAGQTPHVHHPILHRPETFCETCGLEDWLLKPEYEEVHDEYCQPLAPAGGIEGFCPWCGVDLEEGGDSLGHVVNCTERVDEDEDEWEEEEEDKYERYEHENEYDEEEEEVKEKKGEGKGTTKVVVEVSAKSNMKAKTPATTPWKRKAAAAGKTTPATTPPKSKAAAGKTTPATTPGKRKAAATGGNTPATTTPAGKRKAPPAGAVTASGKAKRNKGNKVTFPEDEASERYFDASEPPSVLRKR